MSKFSNWKFASPLLLLPAAAFAQQAPLFTPGNLVVVVEGCGVHAGTCTAVPNGTGTGTGNSSPGGYGDNQAAPLTLFQFSPIGTASVSYVNSLVLPQTASGANFPVSGEYGSSSEGSVQLSGPGQYLTLMGYGIGAATFDAAPTNYGAAPSNALAQSGSLTGQSYTAVPRVVTLIDPNGNVNSSTAIYNIFNTNNPRSAYTVDGSSYVYVSGQGTGADATGGVFRVPVGTITNAPTAITGLDTSANTIAQDTRNVQVYNGTLYVSVDSKEGSNNARSFVGTLGTPPATGLYSSGAGPTQLASTNNASPAVAISSTGKLVLTASETNGINSTGLQINLSPSSYFFANPSTLYIADTGNPKQNSASSLLGDGGLQKWVNSKADGSGTWALLYTLASGLNLVQNPSVNKNATSGATGLYGLTGLVSGNVVYLYATNYNISDLDPTYLYGITDTLAATTGSGETFTQLAAAPLDSNFKGVSLAPTLPAGSATITSVPSGLAFTSTGTGCAPGTYTTPVTLIWTPGNSCQLSVATPQSAQSSPYVFSQWQDGTTARTDTVTAPSTSATYTATFTNNFQPFGNLESAFDSVTRSTSIPQTDSVYVGGWVADAVDGAPLSNVQVYFDGVLVAPATTGIARPDVATAYNNSAYTNSGYQFYYPASSLTAGAHAATVIATDSNGRATTFGPLNFTVTAVYKAPVGNFEEAVDTATASTTIPQTDSLFVSGWAGDPQDGDPLQSLNVFIDGTLAGPATQGIARPDVASATGNPAYANSGYHFVESVSSLSVGSHSVTVVGTDSHGLSTTFGPLTINVTAVNNPPVGNLDQAVDNVTGSTSVSQADSLFVSGWAADAHDNGPARSVQIFIDGNPAGTATLGQSRPDVAAANNNPAWANSGYVFTTPASGLSLGTHTVTATATDSLSLSTTFGPLTITVTP